MNITDLGVFDVILIGISIFIVAIVLMHIAGDSFVDEKAPWWRRWSRWK